MTIISSPPNSNPPTSARSPRPASPRHSTAAPHYFDSLLYQPTAPPSPRTQPQAQTYEFWGSAAGVQGLQTPRKGSAAGWGLGAAPGSLNPEPPADRVSVIRAELDVMEAITARLADRAASRAGNQSPPPFSSIADSGAAGAVTPGGTASNPGAAAANTVSNNTNNNGSVSGRVSGGGGGGSPRRSRIDADRGVLMRAELAALDVLSKSLAAAREEAAAGGVDPGKAEASCQVSSTALQALMFSKLPVPSGV